MEELPVSEIKRAIKDDQAFRLLYNHYSPYIWRVIFRTVHGNSSLATEVLQSVFVTVSRSLKKFRFKSAFSTWLYQIAWRESISLLNKQKKWSDKTTPLNEDTIIQSEESSTDELSALLDTLQPEERFLLVSKEIDGFSFEELAQITGKKSGALRTAVSRIKQKLREVSHEE